MSAELEPLALPLQKSRVNIAPWAQLATPISEAMLGAAPEAVFDGQQELALADNPRKQYMVGALAAIQRRMRPIEAPNPFDCQTTMPNDDESLWRRTLDISEMPYLASPAVELVREMMPDLVMAADRGGRFLGLAVFRAWHQRYPETPFPTIDSKIHFGRITKKIAHEDVGQVVQSILNRSGVMAEAVERNAEGSAEPIRILFLDDWVHKGKTVAALQKLIHGLLNTNERCVNLDFAVGTMRGTRLDTIRHAVGDTRRDGKGIWTDNSEYIGVDYDSELGRGIKPLVIRTQQAQELRVSLAAAICAQILPVPMMLNQLTEATAI